MANISETLQRGALPGDTTEAGRHEPPGSAAGNGKTQTAEGTESRLSEMPLGQTVSWRESRAREEALIVQEKHGECLSQLPAL